MKTKIIKLLKITITKIIRDSKNKTIKISRINKQISKKIKLIKRNLTPILTTLKVCSTSQDQKLELLPLLHNTTVSNPQTSTTSKVLSKKTATISNKFLKRTTEILKIRIHKKITKIHLISVMEMGNHQVLELLRK